MQFAEPADLTTLQNQAQQPQPRFCYTNHTRTVSKSLKTAHALRAQDSSASSAATAAAAPMDSSCQCAHTSEGHDARQKPVRKRPPILA